MKSLYTSIPNNGGIKPGKEASDNYLNKTLATKVIINDFLFNSKNYLQIIGYVMGLICVPAYTNISMPQLKKTEYISSHQK